MSLGGQPHALKDALDPRMRHQNNVEMQDTLPIETSVSELFLLCYQPMHSVPGLRGRASIQIDLPKLCSASLVASIGLLHLLWLWNVFSSFWE